MEGAVCGWLLAGGRAVRGCGGQSLGGVGVAWRGSGALENGLNHGQQAWQFGTKQEDTLHVANHHSYEKATLNSKSNPIQSNFYDNIYIVIDMKL